MKSKSPQKEDLSRLSHAYQVRFACFCARQVLHLVKEKDRVVCEAAITTAEKWLAGEATVEECRANANAAYAAAYTADAAAAADAAHAANAAAHAAYAANAAAAAYAATASAAAYAATNAAHAAAATDRQKLIDEQWSYFEELLHFHDMFEKVVLA